MQRAVYEAIQAHAEARGDSAHAIRETSKERAEDCACFLPLISPRASRTGIRFLRQRFYFQSLRIIRRTNTNAGTKIIIKSKYFILYLLDVLLEIVYDGGAGIEGPAPFGLYQFSNLRIAAVIRPEMIPARMSAGKPSILLGCAAGFGLRRFFFLFISFTSFP